MRRFFAFAVLPTFFLIGPAFDAHADAAFQPRIISRSEWGADASLLYSDGKEVKKADTSAPTEDSTVPGRVKDCEEAQRLYPEEFKPARTVTTDASGKKLKWPQSYSSSVKLLVVHHTAQNLRSDARSPIERVRALYQYHAGTLGWGDIGYHYLIDEDGAIYEGRAGGDLVIGGHAYCANVGTIGIALVGNFELDAPSQIQVQSLQWLLRELADRYHLNVNSKTTYHGKTLPVIVGHRDVVSTACPGYFVAGVLDQIREHVAGTMLFAPVTFPAPLTQNYVDRTDVRRQGRLQKLRIAPSGPTLTSLGSTEITLRPGGQTTLSLTFRAGDDIVQKKARIASVARSSPRIGIWQLLDDENLRVRSELLLPTVLHPDEIATIRLRVQVPEDEGTYSIDIGTLTFTLSAQGRRTRDSITNPVPMTSTQSDHVNIPTPGAQRAARSIIAAPSQVSSAQSSLTAEGSHTSIRIRLTALEGSQTSCADFNLVNIQTRYRGTVTCQMIAGVPMVINEVPMEDYLAGLAEQGDSEPYEKQRAFAVAARSYATFYLDPLHRKFLGMPFDGDDSPAHFQTYRGLSAELKNPQWVRAVRSTAGQVLTRNNAVIKAAYFSSDDGRTRSPSEAGWKDFPFPEVFVSKPDPWCKGLPLSGHGVGMSGCGAEGQVKESKTAEEILQYYYPGTEIRTLTR